MFFTLLTPMSRKEYNDTMEPKKVGFELIDITFHSRDFRPTQSFERAQVKARAKGSKVVRVYGIPRLVIDPETNLVYFGIQFSEDVLKKFQSGKLMMEKNIPLLIDEETQKKVTGKEKRRLKNLTRFWRKDH